MQIHNFKIYRILLPFIPNSMLKIVDRSQDKKEIMEIFNTYEERFKYVDFKWKSTEDSVNFIDKKVDDFIKRAKTTDPRRHSKRYDPNVPIESFEEAVELRNKVTSPSERVMSVERKTMTSPDKSVKYVKYIGSGGFRISTKVNVNREIRSPVNIKGRNFDKTL